MSASRKNRLLGIAASLALACGLMVGCGGNHSNAPDNSQGGGKKANGPALAVFSGNKTPIVANFNPYSATVLTPALGAIYEPLFFYNKADATKPVPLLGESFEWSEDGTHITLKLRKGVQWNDGKPFTAEDVVYSFTNDAVKMDFLKEAKAVDENTVELTFKTPSFTNEYQLMGATYIVPKHVFEKQKDLVTWDNAQNPVGTGAYLVDNVTSAAYTLKANPKYWDKERGKVEHVQYVGIEGNSSAESLFKAGELDYSTFFVPKPDDLVKTQNLGYLNVSSPNPIVVLVCSNADLGCKGAQTDKAVRQALNIAIDRTEINQKAYYNLATLASPALVKPERDDKWIADGVSKLVPEHADVDGAKKIMEEAGYKLGSDGIYAKDGQRASIKIESVEGWSDANAAVDLMVAQAKKAGIELKAETVTNDQYTERRMTGDYQMFYGAIFGTAISDPYKLYHDSLGSKATQPVGKSLQPGQLNYARYASPDVDKALEAAASTNDEAKKKEAYATVQKHLVDDVPYIPMFHGGSQTFFNNKDFTGWPSESDLYAFPASWDGVSSAYVISKLKYK